mgnify:FL=1
MKYIDRKGNITIEENEQDKFLRHLYNDRGGRLCLKLLIRPFVSKAAGVLLNTRLSARFVPDFVKNNKMSPHKTNKNMETSFKQTTSNKVERYRLFLPQFELLISDEKEEISVLANTAAALREAFGFFWVGFYLVKDDQLILGPFQGSTACYRIHKGKGVCGTSWAEARTLIVPNVEQFPGHIACSSLSRSEIVVPILANGQVKGVLDIDSDDLGGFDETDARFLEEMIKML